MTRKNTTVQAVLILEDEDERVLASAQVDVTYAPHREDLKPVLVIFPVTASLLEELTDEDGYTIQHLLDVDDTAAFLGVLLGLADGVFARDNWQDLMPVIYTYA